MVSWKPQPVYTIYGFVIASVACGDESKTLFLITSIEGERYIERMKQFLIERGVDKSDFA